MSQATPGQTDRPELERARGDLKLPLFTEAGVFHFFGTRLSNRKNSGTHAVALLNQVHRDGIVHLDPRTQTTQQTVDGDAWLSNSPGHSIGVLTADCCPILLYDPVKKVAAAIHAGWRGAVLNIVGKSVSKMISYYDCNPSHVLAGIGPTIGPCCFEVQEDVVQVVKRASQIHDKVLQRKNKTHWHFNLPKLNRLQLAKAGLKLNQIASIETCTSCHPETYYSFRRDGRKKGHMMSGIRASGSVT